MKSSCDNCIKKDYCIWDKKQSSCIEWVGEDYCNTTVNNLVREVLDNEKE